MKTVGRGGQEQRPQQPRVRLLLWGRLFWSRSPALPPLETPSPAGLSHSGFQESFGREDAGHISIPRGPGPRGCEETASQSNGWEAGPFGQPQSLTSVPLLSSLHPTRQLNSVGEESRKGGFGWSTWCLSPWVEAASTLVRGLVSTARAEFQSKLILG